MAMTRNVMTNKRDATLTKYGAKDTKMNLYDRLELTRCIWWFNLGFPSRICRASLILNVNLVRAWYKID